MDRKKMFSKLLAKLFLVPVGVSCFGCCTCAMERKNDKKILESKKILGSIKKFTHEFLMYKVGEFARNHKAGEYEFGLMQICHKIDESFKNDLINFIKERLNSGSYDPQEVLRVTYGLNSSSSDSLNLLRKFAIEFFNNNYI